MTLKGEKLMMTYSFYAMFEEMYRMLQWQSEKLTELENELKSLRESLEEKLEKGIAARTNVEKIEYNFEQLKVENLNGTLHVGIRTGDQGTIEELFQEGNTASDVSIGGQEEAPDQRAIQDDLLRYIRDVIPPALKEKAEGQRLPLSEEQIRTAVEDMIRQSGERVSYYIQQMKGMNGTAVPELVAERVKKDVSDALDRYIDYFRREKEP